MSFVLSIIFLLTFSPFLSQVVFLDQTINIPSGHEIKFPYSLGPKLTAESATVVDLEKGEILFSKNSDKILPIASITKLMTALIFLENNKRDWREKILIRKEDLIINSENSEDLEPAGIEIKFGQVMELEDIFYSSLIRSANDATKVLSRLIDLPLGKKFIDLMNEKAIFLKMNNTYFADVTGLDSQNRSTADDLVKLILAAMKNDKIRETLKIRYHDFPIYTKNGQKFYKRIWNTNRLLGNFINLEAAKTGYLRESGYCLAGLSNYFNRQLIVIILNAHSDEDRFQEAKSLIWWTTSLKHDNMKTLEHFLPVTD